jgi:hypothetical protein
MHYRSLLSRGPAAFAAEFLVRSKHTPGRAAAKSIRDAMTGTVTNSFG